MYDEIERKWLIKPIDKERLVGVTAGRFEQGYLITGGGEFRVRTSLGGGFKAAVKIGKGLNRLEYEFAVPDDVGRAMLDRAKEWGWYIEKTRYHIGDWELDEFHGKLEGLWIAEIEFASEEAAAAHKLTAFPYGVRPISEVTDDPNYKNSELCKREWSPTGYHLRTIQKGDIGKVSKIREELEELEDAVAQSNKILQLVELSDMFGAMEAFAEPLGATMDDVRAMSDVTRRAFEHGARVG